jgi:hypothetical protein
MKKVLKYQILTKIKMFISILSLLINKLILNIINGIDIQMEMRNYRSQI